MKPETAEHVKQAVDVASTFTVIATLVQVLPAVAALFTIIWTGFRIWESPTVREWRGKKPYAE
jgi:hypothetical protein